MRAERARRPRPPAAHLQKPSARRDTVRHARGPAATRLALPRDQRHDRRADLYLVRAERAARHGGDRAPDGSGAVAGRDAAQPLSALRAGVVRVRRGDAHGRRLPHRGGHDELGRAVRPRGGLHPPARRHRHRESAARTGAAARSGQARRPRPTPGVRDRARRLLRRRRAAAGAAPRHRTRLGSARRRDLRLQRDDADGRRVSARAPASCTELLEMEVSIRARISRCRSANRA